MRAKRSKKYRKLMHQYELAFGFREPYQILLDSNFLRAVHSFKMDLLPALERTLQGKVKPLLTKCSLAAIMAAQPINPRTNNPVRPHHLPPPTEVPLRHCSHNEDSTPIDEVECLLSLLAPTGDAKRNKEHYTLATADPPAPPKPAPGESRKRKRPDDGLKEAMQKSRALRVGARSIPGTPIVYVKRSVMVLEPMSNPSENVRDGFEKGKFRAGLDGDSSLGKRKRNEDGGEGETKEKKKRDSKKPKGPNPLSMKKSKKPAEKGGSGSATKQAKKSETQPSKEESGDAGQDRKEDGDAGAQKKRRRRHHKGANKEGGDGPEPSHEADNAGDAME